MPMPPTFYVRIVKSGGDRSWYASRIGESFSVIDYMHDYYALVETLGTWKQLLISKSDAVRVA